jgi:hypothetical protein
MFLLEILKKLQNNRRAEDTRFEKLTEILEANTRLTISCVESIEGFSKRLDVMEPTIVYIGETIRAVETFLKIIGWIISGIAWVIRKISKSAKMLVPIGTLILITAAIVEQFLNKDLNKIVHTWWSSIVNHLK